MPWAASAPLLRRRAKVTLPMRHRNSAAASICTSSSHASLMCGQENCWGALRCPASADMNGLPVLGRKPDSVVLMVGSCAAGLPPASSADLLYSFTPINRCAR
jgi:hypothetical protein